MTAPIRLELPTGFEFGTVNAYLFAEPEPVLVDTGLKTEAGWSALQAGLADPTKPAHLLREERNLRRLLLINTGLDVLYVAGGVALALTLGASNPTWRGHGWGIVVQGAFLFAFDLIHVRRVPRTDAIGVEA